MASLNQSLNLWRLSNESIQAFRFKVILYGIIAVITLFQFVRIQLRIPEYGWTTQKVFHFLNIFVNGVRCFVFVFCRYVQNLHQEIVQHILHDMPSLAFFTTYAFLVLFWAEIYYQTRVVSTDSLRPSLYTINVVVYVNQITLWLILWWKPINMLVILSKMFFAGVSLFAALGFLLNGGSLFLMLQHFHVESIGGSKTMNFNVSFNNLVGLIPTSNNFTSFNGNPGLCGDSLNIQCQGRHRVSKVVIILITLEGVVVIIVTILLVVYLAHNLSALLQGSIDKLRGKDLESVKKKLSNLLNLEESKKVDV